MPLSNAWFVESNDPGGWKLLLKSDSDKIEEAYLNDKVNEPILIESKFYIVNIGARILTHAYNEEEPAKKLIRGTWFYHDQTVKSLLPFNEALASQINAWYLDQKQKAEDTLDSSAHFKAETHFRFITEEERYVSKSTSGKNRERSVSDVGRVFRFELTKITSSYVAKESTSSSSSASSQPIVSENIGDIPVAIPIEDSNSNMDANKEMNQEKTCDVSQLFDCQRGSSSQLPTSSASSSSSSSTTTSTPAPPWFAPHLIDGKYLMKMQATPGGLFDPLISIQHGIEMEYTAEEKHKELEVDHLFLVVHGVGEAMFRKMKSNHIKSVGSSVESIRKLAIEQRIALNKEKGIECNKRVEFLPIEWHTCAHSDEVSLTRDLELVTLPGIKLFREFGNEVFIDLVIYMTAGFRSKILSHVCKRINKIYSLFCMYNPKFVENGGKCSLIGHSLGTVILFDILTAQLSVPRNMNPPTSTSTSTSTASDSATSEFMTNCSLDQDNSQVSTWLNSFTSDINTNFLQLNFQPNAFLALGSPIAFFLCVRKNAKPFEETERERVDPISLSDLPATPLMGSTFQFPSCTNFYNLFHPHDPCSYRIEPLLHIALKDYPPALVAHHDGKLRINYKMKTLGNKLSDALGKLLNPNEWFSEKDNLGDSMKKLVEDDDELHLGKAFPDGCPDILLNNGKRVDYILQEHPFEEANEYISSLTGHTSYFDLPDVARFIVDHVVRNND